MELQQDYIKLDFITVRQPIGDFYIAVIDHKDLLDICYADVRKIQHEGDFETYLGIQRDLDPKRVLELREYVTLYDATFPTSIILSISNKKYLNEYAPYNVGVDEIFDDDRVLDEKFEEVENIFIGQHDGKEKLFIKRDTKTAKIIDGQHRIEGLKNYDKETNGPFETNITIFKEMDIEEQAIVFATINKAQTKVNKSRVYDLYDLARSRSPIKTCHNIAKYLNKKEGSPFLDKIKILGTADDKEETITQATFVECLLPYISKNPIRDRDLLIRGESLPFPKPTEIKKQIFRIVFINKKDAEIAKNVFNYFNAVKATWPTAWAGGNVGDILNKSTGLVALFRYLLDVYLFLCRKDEGNEINIEKIGTVFPYQSFLDRIKPMQNHIKDEEFVSENYLPGGSGRSKLYRRLVEVGNMF